MSRGIRYLEKLAGVSSLNEELNPGDIKRSLIKSAQELMSAVQDIHLKVELDPDSDSFSEKEVKKFVNNAKKVDKSLKAALKSVTQVYG